MRARLILGSFLLTAAVVVAFFVPAALSLADAEREAQVVELQQEAADAAASATEGLRAPGVHEDDPLREAKRRGEDEHAYAIYDGAGRRLAGDGPRDLEPWLRSALDGRSRTGRDAGMRIAAVPLAGGGALRASEPADEADARVRSALVRLGGQGLGLLALASVAAWWFGRRLTRPLRDLGTAAERLGGGDFASRSPRSGMRELDQVGVALDATADRLGSTIERFRRLSADASHQLRTPLTGLRASLETELLQPRPDPTEALRDALGAVERLEQTVVALTELARDEVDPEPFPVDDVLAAAAGRWRGSFAVDGREVQQAVGSGLRALARRPAVDAVLDVLLDNALHHGAGTVSLEASVGVSGVVVEVRDEGTSTATDGEVFARRPAPTGRSGIGLPLARTLAEAEGGRLRLVGTEPTTFQLQLPTGGSPDQA